MLLVHLLELVEVDDRQRELVALAPAALDLATQRVVHRRVVEAAGEGICACRERETGVRARVAAGRGGQLAERLEQLELVGRHGLRALEAHGEDPAQPAVPVQRNGGVAVREHRLVALDHLAHQPVSHLDRLADPLGGAAVGGLGSHPVGRTPDEDARGVRAEQPGGLLAHAQRHLAGVEALVQAAYGIQEARSALRHG